MSEIDYSKAQIYKIVNKLDDKDLYIGVTTITLNKRFNLHKQQAKDGYYQTGYKNPFNQHMYEVGINNFDIVWIKNIPWVKDRKEMEREEEIVIQEHIKKGYYKIWNIDTSKEVKSKRMSEEKKELFSDPEIRKKLSEAKFNYGSVHYSPSSETWCFRWWNDGKQDCKSFSINLYGKRTKEFAEAYQKKIYRELITDDDKDPDEILDDLKYYEIQLGSVYKWENKHKQAWVYQWPWENGKRKCKSFSINKYGDAEAKKMAEDMKLKRYAFEMLKKFANK